MNNNLVVTKLEVLRETPWYICLGCNQKFYVELVCDIRLLQKIQR